MYHANGGNYQTSFHIFSLFASGSLDLWNHTESIPVTRCQGAMRVRCTVRTGNGLQSGLDRSLRRWTFGKMVNNGSHESWGVTVAKSKMTKVQPYEVHNNFHMKAADFLVPMGFLLMAEHMRLKTLKSDLKVPTPMQIILKMMTSTIRMSWEKIIYKTYIYI